MARAARVAAVGAATLAGGLAALAILSPIDPVAWTPDAATDVCDRAVPLAFAPLVTDLPATPDGLAAGPDGALYAGLANGTVARIEPATRRWQIVAQSKPAGAFFTGLARADDGTLYAADEHGGALHRLSQPATAAPTIAVDRIDGQELRWNNDVTALPDGRIAFTTTSQRRNLDQFYQEVLEHRGSGQLILHDPVTGANRVLSGTLQMANGVAVGPDGKSVLVVDSSAYRVLRFPLDGSVPEVFANGLPGFAGNIRRAEDGGYWLTLISPRSGAVDKLAGWPVARRIMAWLPPSVRPGPQPMLCLIRLGRDGDMQAFLARTDAPIRSLSTALESGGLLFVTPAGLGDRSQGVVLAATLPTIADSTGLVDQSPR
jgi:sugar lactone lactonase YvrE